MNNGDDDAVDEEDMIGKTMGKSNASLELQNMLYGNMKENMFAKSLKALYGQGGMQLEKKQIYTSLMQRFLIKRNPSYVIKEKHTNIWEKWSLVRYPVPGKTSNNP